MSKSIIYYHTNWSTYSRNYQVSDLPIDYTPEIAYAFFNVLPDGNVVSGDIYSDFDKRFIGNDSVSPPDDWNSTLSYYGNFGQFRKLKEAGKKFDLTLSVGGWTWSANFSSAVSSTASRANFVNSIVSLFERCPIFSGISIDWEYLSNDGINYGNGGNGASKADANNLLLVLSALRTKLPNIRLSMAVTADISKIKFPVSTFNAVLDEFHIMTYDFASGNWGEKIATHHTNLYPTDYTKFSTHQAVQEYIRLGASPGKILIGAAFYSRGFANTDGIGKAASGGSTDMSWEAGICDYKTLPRSGSVEYWDDKAKATYSYDASKRILNSYDSVRSVAEKCKYIHQYGLKGIIVWESSCDAEFKSERSLMKALYQGMYNPGEIEEEKEEIVDIPVSIPPKTELKTLTLDLRDIESFRIENQILTIKMIPIVTEPTPTPVPVQPPTPTPVPSPETTWKLNTKYEKNNTVVYLGKKYICLNPHTSIQTWNPVEALSLWKLI